MNRQVRSKTQATRWFTALCTLIGTGLVLSSGARAADADGWYTPDQAEQGHVTFNSWCAECHRPDLTGAMGPPLIGEAFLKDWLGKPLRNLYSFEHTKMPANNPGAVPKDKLWNITAYILEKNGFPSGSMPLSPQAAGRMLVKPQGTQASSTTPANRR